MAKYNKYRCPSCGQIIRRESNKQWIKSWCERAEKYVHLQLIKGN